MPRSRCKDITGQRFVRLVVVRRVANSEAGLARWLCRCDCGQEIEAIGGALRSGNTRSCGCLWLERNRTSKNRRHGHILAHKQSPEYQSWASAIQRCTNPKNAYYHIYGGKGVTFHEPWLRSSDLYLKYMGKKPGVGYSLDRFPDPNGNYEPGNVRWATRREQARNRTSNRNLNMGGHTKTISEWASIMHITANLISTRLKRGWSTADAILTPLHSSYALRLHEIDGSGI